MKYLRKDLLLTNFNDRKVFLQGANSHVTKERSFAPEKNVSGSAKMGYLVPTLREKSAKLGPTLVLNIIPYE